MRPVPRGDDDGDRREVGNGGGDLDDGEPGAEQDGVSVEMLRAGGDLVGDAVALPPESGRGHEQEQAAGGELDQMPGVVPACGMCRLIASPGPSAIATPSARFATENPARNPARLLTPFGPGREVERRDDRGGVRRVEEPDPDHDREGVQHRASLLFGGRGLTEPVALSSAAPLTICSGL